MRSVKKLTFGSLFSGIGGLDLGLEKAGMECLWQVEKDSYCNKVLEKHWPKAKRYSDVKKVGKELASVDLICGGFPCQPVSVAGKRKGAKDERWLWPEFIRIVRQVQPQYILVENVPGLLTANQGGAAQEIFGDLASSGYDARWNRISAESVGAPHLRWRVFIVAYAQHGREVADADDARSQGRNKRLRGACELFTRSGGRPHAKDWSIEPNVGRVAHGIPQKLDRGEIDEALRILWSRYGSAKMVQREIGRHVEQTPILQQQMLRKLATLQERGETQKWTHESTSNYSDDQLREMWRSLSASAASQGRQSPEQQSNEHRGTLPKMPYSRTHEDGNVGSIWEKEWEGVPRVAVGVKNRVSRLRALGNSVVPQVAERVGREILKYAKISRGVG